MINVFIGTERKTEIACKVLQHSILKRTDEKVRFIANAGESWISYKDRPLQIGTGFSLQRWNIPKLLDYSGHCIYLDADMLVFDDIADLWSKQFDLSEERVIACTFQEDKFFKYAPNTSVMLIKCDLDKSLTGWIDGDELETYLKNDPKRKKYVQVMHAMHLKFPPVELDLAWNRLNDFKSHTKLLHYTKEPQQPWYYPEHPFRDLWEDALKQAILDGYITTSEVREAVKRWQPATKGSRHDGMHPYWLKLC